MFVAPPEGNKAISPRVVSLLVFQTVAPLKHAVHQYVFLSNINV